MTTPRRWREAHEVDALRHAVGVLAKANAALGARLAEREKIETARAAGLAALWRAVEKLEARQAETERELAALRRERVRGRDPRRIPAAVAARRTGLSPATIRRRIADGTLDGLAVESGGRKRWSVNRTDLERLERGAPGAPGARNGAISGRTPSPEKG